MVEGQITSANDHLSLKREIMSIISYPYLKPKGGEKMMSLYQSFEDLPVILSISQIAEVMGLSRAGAYNLVKREGFPAIRVGEKRLCIPKDMFIEWLASEAEKPLDSFRRR